MPCLDGALPFHLLLSLCTQYFWVCPIDRAFSRDRHQVDVIPGQEQHVMQGIVMGGGLLTARNRRDKPKDKLNEFLKSVEWPGNVGRVPQKVQLCLGI